MHACKKKKTLTQCKIHRIHILYFILHIILIYFRFRSTLYQHVTCCFYWPAMAGNECLHVTLQYISSTTDIYYPSYHFVICPAYVNRSSLRDLIIQHLYGVAKKDHINYAAITSAECVNDTSPMDHDAADDETNPLAEEQHKIVLPSFNELMLYVNEMSQKRLLNSSSQKYVYGQVQVPFSYEIYQEVKSFIFCLFIFSDN